jgi:multiple sugar transport system permease protein
MAPARRRVRVDRVRVAVTVLVGVMAAIWLVPLWLAVITAMKTGPEYAHDASQWILPRDPAQLIANVSHAWTSAGLGPGFVASLAYAATGAGIAILFSGLGAYAITRLNVRWPFFWFVLVFSGTIVPFQMYLIPLFKLYSSTGLYDTWPGLACFYIAICIPFCLFVLRSFFATVPRDLQEAARLDGSGDMGIFWRIFVPLARGPVAVLFLFQFTWVWNDLQFGLVLSTSDGVRPIMPSLAAMQGTYSQLGPPVVLAGALIATLPTLLLFLILGRAMMRGLTMSTGRT